MDKEIKKDYLKEVIRNCYFTENDVLESISEKNIGEKIEIGRNVHACTNAMKEGVYKFLVPQVSIERKRQIDHIFRNNEEESNVFLNLERRYKKLVKECEKGDMEEELEESDIEIKLNEYKEGKLWERSKHLEKKLEDIILETYDEYPHEAYKFWNIRWEFFKNFSFSYPESYDYCFKYPPVNYEEIWGELVYHKNKFLMIRSAADTVDHPKFWADEAVKLSDRLVELVNLIQDYLENYFYSLKTDKYDHAYKINELMLKTLADNYKEICINPFSQKNEFVYKNSEIYSSDKQEDFEYKASKVGDNLVLFLHNLQDYINYNSESLKVNGNDYAYLINNVLHQMIL